MLRWYRNAGEVGFAFCIQFGLLIDRADIPDFRDMAPARKLISAAKNSPGLAR